MPPDQAFEALNRPDWVLHLPPSPVNLLTVHAIDYPRDDDIEDEFTGLFSDPELASFRRDLEDPGRIFDHRHYGLRRVSAAFAHLAYPPCLEQTIIQGLGGDRKLRLPKSWLEIIESGFSHENTALDDDASDEARKIQQVLAEHPNAALQAEGQSLSQWLIASNSGFKWNQPALKHGLIELNLASCKLTAASIPALVSLIEGNGSLRDLNLESNHLLHEPGPAALLARSFRTSVVTKLDLSCNPVDDKAASLHAFLSNLNSTSLHTLEITHILCENRERYHPSRWDMDDLDDEEEEEEDEERKEIQALKEDQAFLALAAFIQRSIPSRRGSQHSAAGEELLPCFCGCPNIRSIDWDGNNIMPRTGSADGMPQYLSSLALMSAVVGHLAHLDREVALSVAFMHPSEGLIGNAIQGKHVMTAVNNYEFHDRSLMPSGSLQWKTPLSRNLDSAQLPDEIPHIRGMLRTLQIARQNVLRATTTGTSPAGTELDQLGLEAAVDRDTADFGRAIHAIASLGESRDNVVKYHSIWLEVLLKQVRRSAFIVLAAARTVGCQVEPLAIPRTKILPGWLRLPSNIRSLCMEYLDEIHVDGFGNLGLGHALSRSQMQAVLSFASDRRTIGFGRVNEVLLAGKRLADEAAVKVQQAMPGDGAEAGKSRFVIANPMLSSGIFAAPKWSWKKAAERCMPQDWLTQATWNHEWSPVDRPRSNPHREVAEAFAFLDVTDCTAFRNV